MASPDELVGFVEPQAQRKRQMVPAVRVEATLECALFKILSLMFAVYRQAFISELAPGGINGAERLSLARRKYVVPPFTLTNILEIIL